MNLYAANGSRIATYGTEIYKPTFGLRRSFPWRFILADVTSPILGADFLKHYGLMVDLQGKCLVDRMTNIKARGQINLITGGLFGLKTYSCSSDYGGLLSEFSDVTRPRLPKQEVKHGVKHSIKVDGPPCHSKFRRLPPHKLEALRKELKLFLELGYIQPSKSPYSSPVHLATKTLQNGDVKYRLVGDYKRLNDSTVADRYPLPHIYDICQTLKGKNVFSVIDLERAYYQIPMHESDIEKTAIITPLGLYEFLVMPPGLKNSGQTFQRFINNIFFDMPFVIGYLDDLLISSSSEEEHKKHLRLVFERLRENGLQINVDKCQLGKEKVRFVGQLITTSGCQPIPEKVRAVAEYPKPDTVQKLRRFLALVNYYRRFLPHAAEAEIPLRKLMPSNKKNDKTPILWNDEAEDAFQKCKHRLVEATKLDYYDPDAQLSLMVDASDLAAGAVLQQRSRGAWKPLGYFSVKFNDREQRYSTYDRELLAVYLGVKHFKDVIEGRNPVIFTDHKPLTFAFKQDANKPSPRQQRMLSFISEYTTDLIHISGVDNIPADVLSRVDAIWLPSTIDHADFARRQDCDEELQNWRNSNPDVKCLKHSRLAVELLCQQQGDKIRICVPSIYRKTIFEQVHRLAHSGVKATQAQILQHYVWPGVKKDVSNWIRACNECQQNKVSRYTKSFPDQIEIPDDRFEHVHIDIVGPLPISNGMRYILTMIDRFSRWPEAAAIPDMTAETVAKTFVEVWVARFGTPSKLTSDQGRQFESQLMKELNVLLGLERVRTTPYHPQSNGMIECWHRPLKTALESHKSSWTDALPLVLLGLRTAIRGETSASEMLYGTTIRIPGAMIEKQTLRGPTESFVANLREKMNSIVPRAASNNDTNRQIFIPKDIGNCTHVFLRTDKVRAALEPPFTGPYEVLSRSNKMLTIKVKNKPVTVSIDRVKPAYFVKDPELALDHHRASSDRITKSGHHVRFRIQ